MSYADERGLVAAVRSVADAGAEVVVVNSGGGDPQARLEAAGLDVPVVSYERRLTPGAVRNIGLARTSAELVSFLAADCVAGDDWIERRVAHHRKHDAVASAIANSHPGSLVARCYQVYRFSTRSAVDDRPPAELYGLSYSRKLFENVGLFREDLRVGEDTELNARIRRVAEVLWAPDVVTFHMHPTTLPAACLDLYRKARGRKWFLAWSGDDPRRLLFGTFYRFRPARAALDRDEKHGMVDRLLASVIFGFFVAAQLIGAVMPTLRDLTE